MQFSKNHLEYPIIEAATNVMAGTRLNMALPADAEAKYKPSKNIIWLVVTLQNKLCNKHYLFSLISDKLYCITNLFTFNLLDNLYHKYKLEMLKRTIYPIKAARKINQKLFHPIEQLFLLLQYINQYKTQKEGYLLNFKMVQTVVQS